MEWLNLLWSQFCKLSIGWCNFLTRSFWNMPRVHMKRGTIPHRFPLKLIWLDPRTIDLCVWRGLASTCVTSGSQQRHYPGVFSRAQWNQWSQRNQPRADNNKPAESSWEEEEHIHVKTERLKKRIRPSPATTLWSYQPNSSWGRRCLLWLLLLKRWVKTGTSFLASSLKEQNELCLQIGNKGFFVLSNVQLALYISLKTIACLCSACKSAVEPYFFLYKFPLVWLCWPNLFLHSDASEV